MFIRSVSIMKSNANGYEPKERDIPVLLDSLQELFQEHGDTVTQHFLRSGWKRNSIGTYPQ